MRIAIIITLVEHCIRGLTMCAIRKAKKKLKS